MNDDDNKVLDAAQLKERGWTETMIRRLLGEPDMWGHVDHWASRRGKRLFTAFRVEAAERMPDFTEALQRSANRRKRPDAKW